MMQKQNFQTKEEAQVQEEEYRHRRLHHVIQTVKKNIPYFILAVVVATAFFAHETLVNDFSNVTEANNNYSAINESKRQAWLKLESTLVDNPLYQDYKQKELATNDAYSSVMVEYNKHKFYNFKSFQEFMNEFGWAFGLFLYSLINLILSFIRKSETLLGQVSLHTTLICVSIFFIRWCFMPQDFGQFAYISTNIILAILISFSAYMFVALKERKWNVLIFAKDTLLKYVYVDIENKGIIVPEKEVDFKISRIEVTDIIVDYEQA